MLLRRCVELDERVELVPVGRGAAVLRDRLSDLLGVAVSVGDREAYLALGQMRLLDEASGRAEILEHLGDLPDIEAGPDHPRPAERVLAAEADAGEPSGAHGLLGQRLDDGALRAPGASCLLQHRSVGGERKAYAERLALKGLLTPWRRHLHSLTHKTYAVSKPV